MTRNTQKRTAGIRLKTALSVLLLVIPLVASCSGPYVKNPTPLGAPGTQASPVEEEYKIRVGDRLDIRLYYNSDLNQEVIVRPDGRISLQLVHEVTAAGLTPAQLNEVLTKEYDKHLEQPEVAVIVAGFGGHKVYVSGEVGAPGVREAAGPMTVMQAISASGGFKDTARVNEVVVIRRNDETFKPFPITVNLENTLKGTDMSQDILLMPYDIVFVPRSPIANVDLWVEQYINKPLSAPRDFLLFYSIAK